MDKSTPPDGTATNASSIVSARLPNDLHALMKLAAAKKDQSVSAFISQVLRERVAAALR